MIPSTFGPLTTAAEAALHYAPQIRNKVVLITGPTMGGVGAEAARVIALHDPKLLILAGRKRAVLEETAAHLATKNIRNLIVDFGSFESVRSAAKEVLTYKESIDVLLLNHGAMIPNYTKSQEGYEAMFTCNHLGTFLFSNLIASKVTGRTVVVGSRAHRFGGVQWDDVNFDEGKTFEKMKAYAQSKTANHLFVIGAKKHWSTPIFTLSPGMVMTGLGRNMSIEQQKEMKFLNEDGTPNLALPWKSLEVGASGHIVASFEESLKDDNGAYIYEGQAVPEDSEGALSLFARDPALAEKLWAMSEEMVGQTFS